MSREPAPQHPHLALGPEQKLVLVHGPMGSGVQRVRTSSALSVVRAGWDVSGQLALLGLLWVRCW